MMRARVRRVAVLVLGCALLTAGCAADGAPPEPEGGAAAQPPQGSPPPKKSRLHRFTFEPRDANRPTGERLEGGEEAELVAADGRIVHLSDFRGQPVVLVFTRGFVGFICPYCSTYTAQLATHYERIRALGAEVLLVFPTEDEGTARRDEFVAVVDQILAEEGEEALPFPVFLDPGLRATTRFNLIGDLSRPSTFVLDENGVVQYAYVGRAPDERPAVARILEELESLAR